MPDEVAQATPAVGLRAIDRRPNSRRAEAEQGLRRFPVVPGDERDRGDRGKLPNEARDAGQPLAVAAVHGDDARVDTAPPPHGEPRPPRPRRTTASASRSDSACRVLKQPSPAASMRGRSGGGRTVQTVTIAGVMVRAAPQRSVTPPAHDRAGARPPWFSVTRAQPDATFGEPMSSKRLLIVFSVVIALLMVGGAVSFMRYARAHAPN